MSTRLYYHLTLLNGDYVSDEVLDELGKINPKEFCKDDNLTELQQGGYESSWEDEGNDMLELSRRFPNDVFVLDSEGEQYYKDYFKNGKVQATIGKVVFPEYDEKNLE